MVFRKRRPEIKPRFVLRAESFPAAGLYPSLKRKLFWRTETSNFRDKPRFVGLILNRDKRGFVSEPKRRIISVCFPLERSSLSPSSKVRRVIKRGLSRKFDVSVLQKSLRFNEG